MPHPTQPVAYVVRASCPSPQVRASYLAWLIGPPDGPPGHAAMVIAAGARKATVIEYDHGPLGPQDDRWIAEVRYTFDSQSALNTYLADHAPRLRAEGIALFGPQGNFGIVEFTRFTGVERWSGGSD